MITGHIGVAAAAKSQSRDIPLWVLMLATFWLDIVFVPLLALGVEDIESRPGTDGGYGDVLIHADWTHSFIGAIALSIAFGVVAARWWGGRAGFILIGISFSHWVLDLIVHHADMPFTPGNAGGLPRFGLGLWDFPAATIVIELMLLVAGAWLYWRSAREVTAGRDSRLQMRANLLGALMLVFGVVVLLTDVYIG
jgi:hypothetical protein